MEKGTTFRADSAGYFLTNAELKELRASVRVLERRDSLLTRRNAALDTLVASLSERLARFEGLADSYEKLADDYNRQLNPGLARFFTGQGVGIALGLLMGFGLAGG